MGLIRERDADDENDDGGSTPWLDLGLRVCPACRRELMAWEERCPADGSEGVPQRSVQTDGVPPVPAHLLDDEDDEPSADDTDTDTSP